MRVVWPRWSASISPRAGELRAVARGTAPEALPYDTLIVTGGSQYSYFGHQEWQQHAAELKSLEGASPIRRRILDASRRPSTEPTPSADERLTFVVVGAGPTGVEMAGQIAEIAHDTRGDFRSIDPRARILLIEALDRVLTSFPEPSSKALRSLENLGATTLLSRWSPTSTTQRDVKLADEDTERIRGGRSSGPPA